MVLANEASEDLELSLELCLGRPLIRPAGVSLLQRSGDRDEDSVAHRFADGCSGGTRRFGDGRETIVAGDKSVNSRIEIASDKQLTESCQASCGVGCIRSEVDDRIDFPQRFRNGSAKATTPVGFPAHGCVPQDASASAGAGRLLNARGGAQWKDLICQQRKRELQAQKQQAARKKRKMLIGEQKQQKLQLEKSKPFPGSPKHSKSSLYTQKSVERNSAIQYQKEAASERLLIERTSSQSLLASQLDTIERKQSILKEARAQFRDIRRSVQEQDRPVTDKELMAGLKPKEDNEANLPTQFYPYHKYSQLSEGNNELQAVQSIQEFHKMTSPIAPSFTDKKNFALIAASNGSQTNCRKAEQIDILPKRVEILVDESEKEFTSDKGQRCKNPTILKDQISAENEITKSPTTRLEVDAVSAPFFSQPLPTNNAPFVQMTFAFPFHASNVEGFSAMVPCFMPYVAAQPLCSQGESPFTSYQFISPDSKPLQMATLETTTRGGTTLLRPTPVRHPSISSTKPRNRPGESQQQEHKCSQGKSTLLPNEIPTLGVPSKPQLSGDISSEYSKGGSFLDHAHSHVFSGTSSGIEVSSSRPSQSRNSSSSSSEVYQSSAHGETVESYPTQKTSNINSQAIQEHGQRTDTETGAAGPLVSTTANGKTINGVLFTFSKGDVKIRCECHGNYMNAGEFVIHGGGVAGSHPERSIVVINPFTFTNPSPAVQC